MARNAGHKAETTVAHLNTRLNNHFLRKISLKFSNCRFIRIQSTLHNILSLNLAVSYHRKKNTFSKSKLWRLPAQQRVWPLTLHVVRRLVTFGIETSKQLTVWVQVALVHFRFRAPLLERFLSIKLLRTCWKLSKLCSESIPDYTVCVIRSSLLRRTSSVMPWNTVSRELLLGQVPRTTQTASVLV